MIWQLLQIPGGTTPHPSLSTFTPLRQASQTQQIVLIRDTSDQHTEKIQWLTWRLVNQESEAPLAVTLINLSHHLSSLSVCLSVSSSCIISLLSVFLSGIYHLSLSVCLYLFGNLLTQAFYACRIWQLWVRRFWSGWISLHISPIDFHYNIFFAISGKLKVTLTSVFWAIDTTSHMPKDVLDVLLSFKSPGLKQTCVIDWIMLHIITFAQNSIFVKTF